MPKRAVSEPKKRAAKKGKMGKYSDADPKPVSDINLNKRFTDELEVIKKAMEREGENVFKVRNTAKAINEIKTWGVEIVDEESAAMAARLPGVGKGTVESILEILSDGSSLRAAQAVVGQTAAEKAVEELSMLEGVGSTTATRLAENNIRSFEDVRQAIATSSGVLKDCKTPDAAVAHAQWVEETMQPTSRAEAEAVREAVHAIASKHGITSTELSGAYARGETELRAVRLLLVAGDWKFEHRLDKLGVKCKSFANKAAKGGDPEGNMPLLETILQQLKEKHVAQAVLRSAPHSCTFVCVPTADGAVVPAGVLADAGRVAGASAESSKPITVDHSDDDDDNDVAEAEQEHADAEPIDNSMAAAASSSSASAAGAASMQPAPKQAAKASSNAASKLAAMLADVDDLEAEDEGAQVAQGWSEAASAATAAATPGVSSSSTATAAQAIGGKPVMLEAEAAAAAAEQVRTEAEEMRGWLDRKALDTIIKAERLPPFGTIVSVQIVPAGFAASARVIQSFGSDALMSLRAKAQRNGASIGALGVTMMSDETKVVPSKVAGKPDKVTRLPEDLSREVETEAEFWKLIGVSPIAPAQRA